MNDLITIDIAFSETYIESNPLPVLLRCPNCGVENSTMVELDVSFSPLTWLTSGLLFIFFWPLTCLPFCNPEREYHHYCSICNAKLS